MTIDPLWAQKFWPRVDKEGPTVREGLGPCWLWTGSRQPRGYGHFYPKLHVGLYAHRVSWELAFGPIPAGLHVLHHCDNPPCVRPEHLFVGTRSDNMKDMLAKGRGGHRGAPGERHPCHKLTDAQVVAIRERWDAGGVLQRTLAAEFGVTRGLIGMIVRRVAWKCVA